MATDIVDKELKTLRNLRWDRAFSPATRSFSDVDTVNRKATIVIEHLIQASDVAHTSEFYCEFLDVVELTVFWLHL